MPDIVCPECGNETELLAVRRAAEEFCRHCDFPLFWAPSNIPVTTPGANSDATLRRLPGAGGRQRVGSKICPECGELNAMGETHCQRCSADLDPKPVETIAEALPPPTPAPVVFTEPDPWWKWWLWWPLVALCTTLVVVPLLLWWIYWS